MATPSLAMIPSAYADSKVYSVLPNNGDGDFTFNRDSSATRVGQNGLIQTVGFFGSELVTNGDFATDSNWIKETGWTISGGKASYNGSASNNAIYQTISVTSGKIYKLSFTVVNYVSGTLIGNISTGATAGGTGNITANGDYSFNITASGALCIFRSTSSFNGSIDNVSVQEVTGDQPRLNYDISNGVVQSCPSLLLEPASTNLITYSEDLNQIFTSNSTSGDGSFTVTPNYGISPSGTNTATRIQLSASSGSYADVAHLTSSLNGTYTYSVYIKSLSGTPTMYLIYNGSSSIIQTISEDWVRYTFTFTHSGSVIPRFLIEPSGGTSASADILVWGAQLEALSYATSYIPTNGSSQTRAAETCNGAGTASTFNSTEGVLYAEISALADGTNQRWISIGSGSNANRVSILFNATNKISCSVRGSSTAIYDANFNIGSQTNNTKAAIRYKNSDFAFFVNGVKVDSQQSGSLSFNASLSELAFDSADGGSDFYGNTKDLRVYNEALTDAQLQTLTTL